MPSTSTHHVSKRVFVRETDVWWGRDSATALHAAACTGEKDVVVVLLEHGIDVTPKWVRQGATLHTSASVCKGTE